MKNKEALGAWITAEEKEAWKELARKNNMTLSAFTSHTLKEILQKKEVNKNRDPKCSVQDLKEEIVSSVKVRFTKSELDALRELSERRGQSRQEVIVAAVRQLLLQKLCWIQRWNSTKLELISIKLPEYSTHRPKSGMSRRKRFVRPYKPYR